MAGLHTGIIAGVGTRLGRRAVALALLLAAVLAPVLPTNLAWAGRSSVQPGSAVLRSVLTNRRVVALTFDDGPSPYTPQVLGVLHAFHAHATFFEIGTEVAQYPALSRAVLAAGDEIGNHTYTHPDLMYLSDDAIQLQLAQTQAAIQAATGIRPGWFRPPDGAIDGRVAAVAVSLGLRPALWSVDPRDWSLPGTEAIVERVLSAVRPGGVVLFHDGGGYRGETVQALPIILRALRAQGYRFLTLSGLAGLPVPSQCNEEAAARWFAADGHRVRDNHAIYLDWLQSYCDGKNFGPATSAEYTLGPGTVAQDFARTAHRLEWNKSAGTIHVTLMWPWASTVFSARGVQPLWHTPITQAWFDEYFRGFNWGPALHQPRIRHHREKQCFLYGCAVLAHGHIRWRH